MTRSYWGGVMLVSVLITSAAGWYLSTALTEKKTVVVPLTPVEIPVPASLPPTVAADMPTSTSNLETPKSEVVDKQPTNKSGKHNILFSYKNSTAKKVTVIGSFNKWFRQPMHKKDNIWSFTVELEPGTYEYKFVVDNKRVKDPNNKITSKAGNSVLNVKPATEN